MAEVDKMKIDGADEVNPKIDCAEQKKPRKRKRTDLTLYTANPEEKQANINSFRNEINSLVKFFKNLVLENRGTLLEDVEKISGASSASLNCVIACLMEESELPLSKLVDEIFEKIKGVGSGDGVSKASVKSTVLMIGQRLSYGVTNADADILEDETANSLWCWEMRDLKPIPKLVRISVQARRTCRKKIHERITAVLAMVNALEKSDHHQNSRQELIKASKKLDKALNEADIRLLVENMTEKNGAEIAENEGKKEEKLLIKQMLDNKREMEKERKKMERELQKEKLQSEKELKRLHDEAEKEERRREREEHEMQKQLKRQQEEAERDQKRKEKEEAELKKQLAVKKQASIMERFLKRNKKTSNSEDYSNSMNKATVSESSLTGVERKSESVAAEMDSVLAQNVAMEAKDIWKSHLNSWHSIGRMIRSNNKVHWSIRKKPKTELVKELKLTTNKELSCDEDLVEEKLMDGWVDSNTDGKLCKTNTKGIRSKQLLQFDKSHRPAFYGVWPRNSQVIGARHPFAKDPDLDYEIDSDEEWEEEEPGESLSDCDKEDEDESVEKELKGDDEDESEDGFFVPDGYLSENEGAEADDMECDESFDEVKSHPDSEKQAASEEFCTLLRQQKYLNNLTDHALKKNQPLIILNLMHEKTTLLQSEELVGTDKIERTFLQTLSIRCLLGFPHIEISLGNDAVDEDCEALPNKSSTTPVATSTSAVEDSDLPQIVSIIHSCPNGIGKIVESLHNMFPALPKSQLRNKVREISDFSENRWQVKKEILNKLGLSISPEKNCAKAKSITSFFSKRCLPPSDKTVYLNETN